MEPEEPEPELEEPEEVEELEEPEEEELDEEELEEFAEPEPGAKNERIEAGECERLFEEIRRAAAATSTAGLAASAAGRDANATAA